MNTNNSTATRATSSDALTVMKLLVHNQHFVGTAGVSAGNRDQGFRPAVFDTDKGSVHLSKFADGRLQNERSARAWLFSILRRENARRYSKGKAMEVNDDSTLDTIPDSHSQPDQKLLLRDVCALLPDSYRSVLILQAQDGYSCREIAELLELSPNAVMVRLSRARALIKVAFQSR